MAGRARVAVVGAGVSGSICAALLQCSAPHLAVTLFDLSARTAGGRASARRPQLPGSAGQRLAFDSGAQFIHVSDSRLRQLLKVGRPSRWRSVWRAKCHQHCVRCPSRRWSQGFWSRGPVGSRCWAVPREARPCCRGKQFSDRRCSGPYRPRQRTLPSPRCVPACGSGQAQTGLPGSAISTFLTIQCLCYPYKT
jgi:hypothetical protein